MAHIAGLVAAGLHHEPHPLCGCGDHHHPQDPAGSPRRHDPVQGRAGQDRSTRPCSPAPRAARWMHIIAAKAVCFGEALKPEFKTYQQQIVKNAKALADGLLKRGLRPGIRRHRQPPDAGGSAQPRHHRQGAGAPSGRGVHHRQQERHPQRPGEPLCHKRHPHRHTGRHHPRLARKRIWPRSPS